MCSLDGSIQRQQLGLPGDLFDVIQHTAHSLDLLDDGLHVLDQHVGDLFVLADGVQKAFQGAIQRR